MFAFRSLLGSVEVTLVSADVPGLLQLLNEKGIEMYCVEHKAPLTVRIEIDRRWYPALRKYALSEGASIKTESRHGNFWTIKRFLKRPVLLSGILLVIALSLWLPTRVLFIEVEGNREVPTNSVLEQAGRCGIVFGASRREVRSEKMKNNLIAAIPQLQWAGINTVGCTAIISVEERATQAPSRPDYSVGSIVAAKDGVIESCTTTKGTALCKAGQAVKAGDVLISGYTDCGISIRATQAEGEVFAKTFREITVVVPANYVQKGIITGTETKYSLLIGKKRINFFKDSGIYDTTCVKMYKEYPLALPGDFTLPVVLIIEQRIYYDCSTIQTDSDDYQDMTAEFAQSYLCGQMISGRILDESASVFQTDETLIFRGKYLCSEMIGRVRYEGIIKNYGKDN